MGDAWTFSKQTVEQYQFRGPHGLWAIITLDPRGIFQAVSDLGTYAYDGWGHHGCASFKHFLMSLRDPDYFLSKVCGHDQGRSGPGRAGQVFDFDKSVAEIRRRICERRREGLIDRDDARLCWDEADAMEDTTDSTYFVMVVERDCPTLFKSIFHHDYCDVPTCATLATGPLRFFKEIFREQLVPALQAECASSQREDGGGRP